MAKVVHLSTDLWAFGRTTSKGFPMGFVTRMVKELSPGRPFLHLCSGQLRIPEALNVDIRRSVSPDLQVDATQLPFRDGNYILD